MGIVISFVGWRTDIRSSEIYQKQLEILQNDRGSYFTISCETVFDEYKEDGYYRQIKYTIKNEGGMLSEAYILFVNSYLIINIPIHKSNNYKHFNFVYEIEDRFSTPTDECFYNEETKELIFYGIDNSQYLDFSMNLEQELNRILKEDDIAIRTKNYVKIYYVNFKNEEYTKEYEFTSNKIVISESDDDIYISIDQSKDIGLVAKEIYDYIERWDDLSE